MTTQKHIIIGRYEWGALPDLNLPAIKMKTDTGARTSSLHAENIERFTQAGKKYVRFTIAPLPKFPDIQIECTAPLVDQREVTSSTGQTQKRPVIVTPLKLGNKIWPIEITLTDRSEMGYRMLLGRQAFIKNMLVDVNRGGCMGKQTSKQAALCYKNQ